MGHPGLCGLSSLATCTRPAMWTRSDCVPRETRNRGALGVGGGLGGSKEQPCDLNKPSKAQVSILVL